MYVCMYVCMYVVCMCVYKYTYTIDRSTPPLGLPFLLDLPHAP